MSHTPDIIISCLPKSDQSSFSGSEYGGSTVGAVGLEEDVTEHLWTAKGLREWSVELTWDCYTCYFTRNKETLPLMKKCTHSSSSGFQLFDVC